MQGKTRKTDRAAVAATEDSVRGCTCGCDMMTLTIISVRCGADHYKAGIWTNRRLLISGVQAGFGLV